jgi:hypothetical protein
MCCQVIFASLLSVPLELICLILQSQSFGVEPAGAHAPEIDREHSRAGSMWIKPKESKARPRQRGAACFIYAGSLI